MIHGVAELKVGEVMLGDVAGNGGTTSYKDIAPGNYNIYSKGAYIGELKLKGKVGTHKWTIFFSVNGTLSVAED